MFLWTPMLTLFMLYFSCQNADKMPLDADGDGYFADEDCDDSSVSVYPGADEICDGIDNNCDSLIDDEDPNVMAQYYFVDADMDGFGSASQQRSCHQSETLSTIEGDCDDSNPEIHPYAEEICNQVDDNCNGQVDDSPIDAQTYYADNDGDGYGAFGNRLESCQQPADYVENHQDCEDNNANIHPAASEVCDEIDNDCNGLTDENDPNLDTQTAELYYVDSDGDGYGNAAEQLTSCDEPIGYVQNTLDCDDSNTYAHPGILYDSCNATDDDCDGLVDEDVKAGWQLVSIDTNADKIFTIDPTSAATTEIMPLFGNFGVNSMDVSEGVLSLVHDGVNKKLWTLNACTGDMIPMPTANPTVNTCGIAFGPGGKLYGIDSQQDRLVEYNQQTGEATPIGPLGISLGSCGLTYDCSQNRLIGANGTTNEIFSIDPVTGMAYDIVQTQVPFASVGVEFDHTTGLILASTRYELYTIEPLNGSTTFIGTLGGENIDDLAYYPQCP